jgi:Zn-dependent peptidase ImmA (M78 family)
MVRMVPDGTGRFAERPHYSADELDRECEHIVSAFLRKKRGDVRFPIVTDDLHVLIEQHEASLDAYADLSAFGDDVEGVTEFFPDKGPMVSISERLANDSRRENRLRTTLSHEFGHVHFHRHLWAEKFISGRLFERNSLENKAICKRDTILNASQYDWMEWQAGYVSGAILMPASHVRRLVTEYCQPRGLHGGVYIGSDHGRALIGTVMEQFAVSEDAARIRLLKLNLLATSDSQPSLFG